MGLGSKKSRRFWRRSLEPQRYFDNIDFSKPVQNGPKELGFIYSYGHSGSLDMASYVYVKEKSKEENPFFLYLALPSPHTPILPTEEWQGKSGLNPYGDFVLMVDAYMGQLEKVIKETGVENNTIIISLLCVKKMPIRKFEVNWFCSIFSPLKKEAFYYQDINR